MRNEDEITRRYRAISWVDMELFRGHTANPDYLRGWAEGRYPAPPICELMNIKLVELDRGRAVFACTPGEYHYSLLGTLHGGVLSTLIDSACGIAGMSLLPHGTRCTTVNMKVSFLRTATAATGIIRCEGIATYQGDRILVIDAVVRARDGRELASGRCTCITLEDPAILEQRE